MLKLRKRGRVWHLRGTARVGRQSVLIEETTGCRSRDAADAYRRRRQGEVERALALGDSRRPDALNLAFHATGIAYLKRAAGVHRSDNLRCEALGDWFADFRLGDIDQRAWNEFCAARLAGRAPGTLDRYRTVLVGVFAAVGLGPPPVAKPKYRNERVRWLTPADAALLHASYGGTARDVVTLWRFQGSRTGETLRLDRRDVDFADGPGTIYFRATETKTGRARKVPMHPAVRKMLERLLSRPAKSFRRVDPVTRRLTDERWYPVFIGARGRPYHDSRQIGGNPLSRAHATAMARAAKARGEEIAAAGTGEPFAPRGGAEFTPHDWRHHWATWFLREGGDLRTLQELGGWASLDQIQRYAAVDPDYAAEQLARVR